MVQMPRTLIVDDSPTMRRMVMASLREVCPGGFVEASSGLEAIERLAVIPVALIVLDLNMPDMHGLDVLRFIRRHNAVRRAARHHLDDARRREQPSRGPGRRCLRAT